MPKTPMLSVSLIIASYLPVTVSAQLHAVWASPIAWRAAAWYFQLVWDRGRRPQR